MTDVLTYADHVDEVSSRRAVPVDVEELTVGVPDRDEPILGPIDLHLAAGSRILVSGPSGLVRPLCCTPSAAYWRKRATTSPGG